MVVPVASSVEVEYPSVISPVYVLSASSMYSNTLVPAPTAIGKTPSTSGSNVPACPTFLIPSKCRIRLTQAKLVIPFSFQTGKIPSTIISHHFYFFAFYIVPYFIIETKSYKLFQHAFIDI